MDAEREELEGLWRFFATAIYMVQDAADVLDDEGTSLNPQLKADIEKKIRRFVVLIFLKVVS